MIINAALNLVAGKELAWQERKAASFVFTPRFCGYEWPAIEDGPGGGSKGWRPPIDGLLPPDD